MDDQIINQKIRTLLDAANQYLASDPNASILKVGILGELLTIRIFQEQGIPIEEEDQHRRLIRLARQRAISAEVARYFHKIRISRNQAIHVDVEGNFGENVQIAQEAINNAQSLIALYPELKERSALRQPKTPPKVQDSYRKERVTPKRQTTQQPQNQPPSQKQTSTNYTAEEYQKALEFLAQLDRADDPYPLSYKEHSRLSDVASFFDEWKKGFANEKEAAIEYLRFMSEEDLI